MGKLASYRGSSRAVEAQQDADMVEALREVMAEAESQRRDLLDREAKLRQAADLANDAVNRADNSAANHARQIRALELAKDEATRAREAAEEVLAEMERRAASVRQASLMAASVQTDAVALRQEVNLHGTRLENASADLTAFRSELAAAQEDLLALRLPPPGAAPGAAAHTAFVPLPGLYPGCSGTSNPSGWLNNQMIAMDANITAADITGGGTITGDLTLSGINLITDTSTGTKIATGATQKLGFFGATPVARIAGTVDVLAGMVTLGFRAASSNPPLDLGTGAFACGSASFSDVVGGSASGAGTPMQAKQVTVTPPSNADYTLTAAEMSCVIITVVAGSWASGHNILVPDGFAGGLWHFSNSTGFAMTVKPVSGTGIAIANARAAWIRTNGVNARRMGPDVDPTV